jgi:hypothetical protein
MRSMPGMNTISVEKGAATWPLSTRWTFDSLRQRQGQELKRASHPY